jgi:hypothetical protein
MLAYVFVVLAVALRFLPHSFGFTPVAASLLFFGARGTRKQAWIPIALLAASDVLLTLLWYRYPFTWDHFVTWVWYAAILWLGTLLRSTNSPLRIGASSLAASVSFFLVSNFAVWAAWNDMYPKTWQGLMTCYAAGIPFFQKTVAGDLFFTAVFFAVPVVVHAVSGAAPDANREAH